MACIGAVVRLLRASKRNILRTVCVVLYSIRVVFVSVLCSLTQHTCLDLINYQLRFIVQ